MMRLDDLAGAVVKEIFVGRSGKIHLYFKRPDGGWTSRTHTPLIVEIPKEPRKRKK